MNEDFSLGKMSADARLTATFKYYEKTEQNGKIVITACLGKGDVPPQKALQAVSVDWDTHGTSIMFITSANP